MSSFPFLRQKLKFENILRDFYIIVIQLANHGVSSSLLEKLKHEIEEFFMLPSEEKMKYKARPGDVEGYGTIIRCNDQTLDWGDRFYMTLNPIQKRKPYLFPELPSSLRFSLLSLSHTHNKATGTTKPRWQLLLI